ncbi:hypothetical protein GJ496_001895, partial [Pomphorhynchus laevis]
MNNLNHTNEMFPTGLDTMSVLTDIRCSNNRLTTIPSCIFFLYALKRLDLSGNDITVLGSEIENLRCLNRINLSRNNLKFLPPSICTLRQLKSIHLNSNRLAFDGIPTGIYNLCNLEIFSACDNKLQLIPEGLFRCPHLRKLYLSNNQLLTLPTSVHSANLQILEVSGNPNFRMPPKADSQSQIIRASMPLRNLNGNADRNNKYEDIRSLKIGGTFKERHSKRKPKYNRNAKGDAVNLHALKDIYSHENTYIYDQRSSENSYECNSKINNERHQPSVAKLSIDYRSYFDETVGTEPSVLCWQINNFAPVRFQSGSDGIFYSGDCYVILETQLTETNLLVHQIYYLIGNESTLDKQACAAVHAINLRDMLLSTCRTIRVEQADAKKILKDLFAECKFCDGSKGHSGFSSIKTQVVKQKAYRLTGLKQDSGFLIDTNDTIYLRIGAQCPSTVRSAYRLFAEQLNRTEKKGRACVIEYLSNQENDDFWSLLKGKPDNYEFKNTLNGGRKFRKLYLFKVISLDNGFGLHQVRLSRHATTFKKSTLNTNNAYFLDCPAGILIWIGEKAMRFSNTAVRKLAQRASKLFTQYSYRNICLNQEGYESIIFISHFDDWDEKQPKAIVNFDISNLISTSIEHFPTADIENALMHQFDDNTKNFENANKPVPIPTIEDFSALLHEQTVTMSDNDANKMIQDCNDNLINHKMDAYVFDGKTFRKLPDEEYGCFYTKDSYIYFARYIYCATISDNESTKTSLNFQSESREELDSIASDNTDRYGIDEDVEDEAETHVENVVYFWQGREASNLARLLFHFQIKDKFKDTVSEDHLEVFQFRQ